MDAFGGIACAKDQAHQIEEVFIGPHRHIGTVSTIMSAVV